MHKLELVYGTVEIGILRVGKFLSRWSFFPRWPIFFYKGDQISPRQPILPKWSILPRQPILLRWQTFS